MNTTECPNDLCHYQTEHSNECYECGALIHKESGWISIKDRLPPQDERVLVWLWEKGEIDIDIIRREGKSDGGGLQFIGNYLHNITFWMPLPTPPNTGEDR